MGLNFQGAYSTIIFEIIHFRQTRNRWLATRDSVCVCISQIIVQHFNSFSVVAAAPLVPLCYDESCEMIP